MKKLNPMKDLGTVEGKKAVERLVRKLVRPLGKKWHLGWVEENTLPLLVFKRINDVFEDEVHHGTVQYHIPEGRTWEAIQARLEGDLLGWFIDEVFWYTATASEVNKPLWWVLRPNYERKSWWARHLVKVLSDYRLGSRDVDPMFLEEFHRALLRLSGRSLRPEGLDRLLCGLASPQPGDRIVLGSNENPQLLGECHRYLLDHQGEERNGVRTLPSHLPPISFVALFPPESVDGVDRVMATAVFHGIGPHTYTKGLRYYVYNEGWKGEIDVLVGYVKDLERYTGLWTAGIRKELDAQGRMAVALEGYRVHSEQGQEFRKGLLEADLLEAVVFTPTYLVILLNRAKRHPGGVLLVEAPADLTRADADRIIRRFERWDGGNGVGTIVRTEEMQRVCDLLLRRYLE